MNSNMNELPPPQPGFKYMACRHCDKPMLVGIRRRNLPSHFECGVQAAIDNSRQMHEKKGPNYDRWRAGMANWFENQGGGGAPRT